MAVNKVVINDKIALDLTGDTVTPSDLVEGVTAHDATGMQITGTRPATGGTDTSDATATAGDIAKGKTAYVQGEKLPVLRSLPKAITTLRHTPSRAPAPA